MNRTVLIVVTLFAAAAVAGVNGMLATTRDLATCGPCVAWFIGGPIALAALALAMSLAGGAPAVPAPTVSAAPREPPEATALRLLSTLQEEGRLVDFLEEDIGPYDDAQIGAAVRGIHEGCRKALRECVTLEAVLSGAEDEAVTIPPGFDSAAIRLTGNVSGAPPFRGVIRHAGWRVRATRLPPRGGQDDQVIAPAEVEIT
jgi:hypothetical protein